MTNPFVQKALKDFLTDKGNNVLETYCSSRHPGLVAEILQSLPTAKNIWAILSLLSAELKTNIFSHLPENRQLEICSLLNKNEQVELLTSMSSDDRVCLLKKDDALYEAIMPALAQAERDNIRLLYHFDQDCAGAFMTSEYATIPAEVTVSEALTKLRLEAPNKETIYCAYIIDKSRKLIGYISLKDLVLAAPNTYVGAIMRRELIYARAHESSKEAVQKVARYDLIALPVLNDNDELLGIITHDDALDIVKREYTEDMQKFMGINSNVTANDYLNDSIWQHFKSRIVWIFILAIFSLIAGHILYQHEHLIHKLALLTLYLPLLASIGGNTSCQTTAVIIRALNLKELSSRNFLSVIKKELGIGFTLGLTIGLLILVMCYLLPIAPATNAINPYLFGLAIALSLLIQLIVSNVFGTILPFLLIKCGKNPALAAGPALTTLMDISGFLIYFYTIQQILNL